MGIETIALVAGAAISGTAAIAAGEQAKATGDYQAEQANADALAAQGEGQVQASKIREEAKRQRAQSVAALAASGVNVSVGTAEQIQTDVTRRGEVDALTAILSGKQASNARVAEGQAAKIAGDNAETAGYLNAAGTALSTFGTASRWRTNVGFSGTQPPAPVQRIS